MKSLVRFMAMLLGGVAVVFGFNACGDKDDDENKDTKICCDVSTIKMSTDDIYVMEGEICSDGEFDLLFTYSDGSKERNTGNWKTNDPDASWSNLEDTYCKC